MAIAMTSGCESCFDDGMFYLFEPADFTLLLFFKFLILKQQAHIDGVSHHEAACLT